MAKILVVGSADMEVTDSVQPTPDGERRLVPGGKGANQAVAAAKLGGDVAFLGRVGADEYGEALKRAMAEAGVDISNVITDPVNPTGTVNIRVAEDGQKSVVVHPGSNEAMTAEDVWDHPQCFADADYVLVQLGIGFTAVQAAVTMGKMMDKRVILKPAPAQDLSPEMLNGVYCIVPNEAEADALFHGYTKEQLPVIARSYGVENMVVTLGSKGALLVENGSTVRVPTMRVKAVDTDGAGDCFVGALAVALSEGQPLSEAVEFANQAAAISITRPGAQAAMPSRDELE